MDIRLINLDEDYDELRQWWKDWRWQPFPKIFLPPSGLMVYEGDNNICAGWLYKTDAGICWIENIISNRHYRCNRDEAILLLLDGLAEIAKTAGFKVIMTATKNQSLIKKYTKNGYAESDKNMEHFVRVL